MITYFFVKSELEFSMWLGIKGFRYNTKRNSPSKGRIVVDTGWYLFIYMFGYELVINRERTKEFR